MPKGKGGIDINRKVGPLPLWGWGAVGVGGWYVYRNFVAPSSAQNAASDGGGYADYGGGGGGGSIDYGGSLAPVDSAPATGDLPASEGMTETPPTVTNTIRNVIRVKIINRGRGRRHGGRSGTGRGGRGGRGQPRGGHAGGRPVVVRRRAAIRRVNR